MGSGTAWESGCCGRSGSLVETLWAEGLHGNLAAVEGRAVRWTPSPQCTCVLARLQFLSSLVDLAVLQILNRHKVVSVGLAAVLW